MGRIVRALYRRLLPADVQNSLRIHLSLLRPDVKPQLVSTFPEQRILVLAPHMDDEVLGCGGTIARHVRGGGHVTVVYLTDGRKGHQPYPREWTEAEVRKAEDSLVARRKQEAHRACQTLGVDKLIFLDWPDGLLRPLPDRTERIRNLLMEIVPNVIYLPSLLDSHEDHWQTNHLFWSSVSTVDKRLSSEMTCRGYEIWSPVPANTYVDITETFDSKVEAMSHFTSQLESYDLIRPIVSLNTYRSLQLLNGKGYSEAFFSSSLSEYRMLFAQLTKGV